VTAQSHELDSLEALNTDIERAGATMVVIAGRPIRPTPGAGVRRAHSFSILADKGGKLAQTYGLTGDWHPSRKSLDPEAGHAFAPATFVLDQEGVVALAFVDLGGQNRMEPDQILMAIECVSRRKGGW
jgi:peroxiredoxin